MISYLLAISYLKRNVKDRSQIFMISNSMVLIPNLMHQLSLRMLTQFMLKNTQFLVGSNGIQFKLQNPGIQHSD